MNQILFFEWLTKEKGLSRRSAQDVISRYKRALTILSEDASKTIQPAELCAANAFQECSMYIKSQLKRAVSLYNEFSNQK